jgi:hypothetical protein
VALVLAEREVLPTACAGEGQLSDHAASQLALGEGWGHQVLQGRFVGKKAIIMGMPEGEVAQAALGGVKGTSFAVEHLAGAGRLDCVKGVVAADDAFE